MVEKLKPATAMTPHQIGQIKRWLEYGLAITFGLLGLTAFLAGVSGIQFASGFLLLAVVFGVSHSRWQTSIPWGSVIRYLLMAFGVAWVTTAF